MKKNRALIIAVISVSLAVAGVVIHYTLPSLLWLGSILILAGVGLMIVLAVLARQQIQTLVRLRQTKFGFNALLLSLVLLAILVLLNFLSVRHNPRLDLTQEGLFTLSPQTVKVLKGLENEIKITSFLKDKSPDQDKFRDLIQEYQRHTQLLRVTEIDPDKEPAITQSYGITQYGTLIIETGGKSIKLNELSENELTDTLIKITRLEQKKICFLDGHGERDIEDREKNGFSQFQEVLKEKGYQTRKLLLMQEEEVPAECILLVLADPRKNILPHEEEAINKYLEQEGNALILAEIQSAPTLERIAADSGIELGSEYIIDYVSRIFGGGLTMPLVTKYAVHEITQDFRLATLFSTVRPVRKIEDTEHQVLELAQTGEQSFATPRLPADQKIQFDPDRDLQGPISVAAVSTRRIDPGAENYDPVNPESGSRLLVFGDADFAANGLFGFSGNSDFILNTVNWLAQEKDLISIRPKTRAPSTVHLTPQRGKYIFYLTVVGLPAAILLFGLGIWWRRRRR